MSAPPPQKTSTGQRPVRRGRTRVNWIAAIGVAIVVHAAAFLWMGVSSGHRAIIRSEARGARWVGERSGPRTTAVDEAIDLLDPSPLFLPTRHNIATRVASRGDDRGPGEIFGEVEPILAVPTDRSPPGLVTLPAGISGAAAAVRQFSRPYFSAFGQQDRAVRRLPPRAGHLEVRAVSGEVVLALDVPASAAEGSANWPMWAPFEMFLAVEPTGSLGPPLVPAPSAGTEIVAESVVEFFRTYLRIGLRGDLRLPAGYYRVVVGP